MVREHRIIQGKEKRKRTECNILLLYVTFGLILFVLIYMDYICNFGSNFIYI